MTTGSSSFEISQLWERVSEHAVRVRDVEITLAGMRSDLAALRRSLRWWATALNGLIVAGFAATLATLLK